MKISSFLVRVIFWTADVELLYLNVNTKYCTYFNITRFYEIFDFQNIKCRSEDILRNYEDVNTFMQFQSPITQRFQYFQIDSFKFGSCLRRKIRDK